MCGRNGYAVNRCFIFDRFDRIDAFRMVKVINSFHDSRPRVSAKVGLGETRIAGHNIETRVDRNDFLCKS